MQLLKKIKYLKIKSLILTVLYSLTINSIVSQRLSSIPKTDSTTVAYYRLNVYEQYRRGFLTQDTLIIGLKEQISDINKRLILKDKLIYNYELKIVPKLENKIHLTGLDLEKQVEIQILKNQIHKRKIKKLKKQNFIFGIVGASIGVVLSILII